MIGSDEGSPASSPEIGSLRAKARLALARRDLLEFIRDRRTLFVTLLLPMAMYPILALSSALGVRTALSDIDSRAAPSNLVVVLSGSPWDAQAFAARVGGLPTPEEGRAKLDWPASVSFGFGSAEDARTAVEAGHADLWIDVPERVLEDLDGSGTISIEARGSDTKVLPPRVRDQFTAVMRGLADDAAQDADRGDAHLHGGEEPGGIGGELERLDGAGIALFGGGFQPDLACREDGEFGHGEQAVEQDQADQ